VTYKTINNKLNRKENLNQTMWHLRNQWHCIISKEGQTRQDHDITIIPNCLPEVMTLVVKMYQRKTFAKQRQYTIIISAVKEGGSK